MSRIIMHFHLNKLSHKPVFRLYLPLGCCRFLWVCGARQWVERGVFPTERPGLPPVWHWTPPEPEATNAQVCTKSKRNTRFDDLSLSPPTWSFSRLLSASGKRLIVFFFTCILSSFSEFPSSLCFSSSNTCTKTHLHCFVVLKKVNI